MVGYSGEGLTFCVLLYFAETTQCTMEFGQALEKQAGLGAR